MAQLWQRHQACCWLGGACSAVLLVASCHLIGGTDGMYIEPNSAGLAGQGGSAFGGAPSTSSSTTSTTSTSGGAATTGSTSSGSAGAGGEDPGCVPELCEGTDTTCYYRACLNDQCGFITAPTKTPCVEEGGSYCDGAGSCVECVDDLHCPNSGTCKQNVCFSASCDDKTQNNGETDVDCGGPNCGDCANGYKCNTASDCQSLLCNGVCLGCQDQNSCPGGYYCQIGAGHCKPKKDWFQACQNGYECKSGNCNIFKVCGV